MIGHPALYKWSSHLISLRSFYCREAACGQKQWNTECTTIVLIVVVSGQFCSKCPRARNIMSSSQGTFIYHVRLEREGVNRSRNAWNILSRSIKDILETNVGWQGQAIKNVEEVIYGSPLVAHFFFARPWRMGDISARQPLPLPSPTS